MRCPKEMPPGVPGWINELRGEPLTPERRKGLEKWYGDKAQDIKWAEAFEVAEYGFQPTDEDLRRYFPMLGK